MIGNHKVYKSLICLYNAQPMGQWIVARTKPRRERWAAENVSRQGCPFYLPQYELPIPRNARVKEARSAVLFPCYLFVNIDKQWKFLLGTFGIAAVIMSGDSPTSVPQSEIDRLMKRHDSNGLISLPKKIKFNPGDEVRIKDGPFADRVGLYQSQSSSERNRILMDFLGGKRTVLFDDSILELA
jgi:transcriptional antiterminator RfaH